MTQQDSAPSLDVHQALDGVLSTLTDLEARLNKYGPTLTALGMPLNVASIFQQIRDTLEKSKSQSAKTTASLDQLQNLVRTSARIMSSLELDKVLEQVIDTVIDMTGAERAYLMLRNTETGELSPRTARNWDRQTISEHEMLISRKVINMALEQKEPILTTNAQQDTRFQEGESVIRYHLRSILCVPMILQDNAVGVLYADNRMLRGAFAPSHIPLLAAFGTQAAITIEHARLFGETRSDLEKARRELEELRAKNGGTPSPTRTEAAPNGTEPAAAAQPSAATPAASTPAQPGDAAAPTPTSIPGGDPKATTDSNRKA